MTEYIELLVVEDDAHQFEAYCDAADELIDENYEFRLTSESTAGDAKNALLSTDFHGAIIDLNLEPGNPTEASGNDVLREIIEIHRFPVCVVSGNLGNLDPSIKEKESGFLRCFDRETPNAEILQLIKKIYSTGITHILGGRGQIETRLGEIFWTHLANDLDVWVDDAQCSEKELLRYTVSHLSEYLDIPSGDSCHYHNAEFYIKPPIRKHIATGDIIERDDGRYIVLSPACDIAVRSDGEDEPKINARKVMIADLVRLNHDSFVEIGIIRDGANSPEKKKALSRIIKGQNEKFAFLPEYKEIYASVIDMQSIHSIEFQEFFKNYKRLATVSGPFLKDIQARFSSYYGRQGQPDLDKNALIDRYKERLNPH